MENPPQNQRDEKKRLDEEQLELQLRSFLPSRSPPPPEFLQVIQQELEWDRELERELERELGLLEFGVVGTGQGEMELDQLNSGCLGYEKSKGKNPGGDSGNKKTIGVRIVRPSEDVLRTKGRNLKDAAKDLNVVDEVGFPRLNFDTLPSDQASAVTVDTNGGVVKVIPPLQFSTTAQQGYQDKDFGIEELEEVEICPERVENDGMSLEDLIGNVGLSLEDLVGNDGRSLEDYGLSLEELIGNDGRSLEDFGIDDLNGLSAYC